MEHLLDEAIRSLLTFHQQNRWFVEEFWPLTEPRVRLMVRDLHQRCPPGNGMRILDVACYNGFISFLLSRLGYQVVGTDALSLPVREELFGREGIEFLPANLNHLEPFKDLAAESFQGVIAGEIIEHILNHPLGFARDLARVLQPGGCLLLTTPNPSTAMNAARALGDRNMLWGTEDFMRLPKMDGNRIISHDAIHYREYTASQLREMLEEAGFKVEAHRFISSGTSPRQSLAKRFLKGSVLTRWLFRYRWFSLTQYVVATKR